MEKILKILFENEVTAEFRKPVVLQYPALMDRYSGVIEKPMDLGTILLKVLKKEADPVSFRNSLQQIYYNSMKFNAGNPLMEAVSIHLNSFTCGLVEEILNIPYYEQQLSSQTFHNQKIAKRKQRFIVTQHQLLNMNELRMLATLYSEVAMTAVPSFMQSDWQQMLFQLSDITKGEGVCDSSSLSLQSFLDGLHLPSQVVSSQPTVRNEAAIWEVMPSTLSPQTYLRIDCVNLISLLDDMIGIVSVCLLERIMRGNTYSSVWAKPNTCAWVQPIKDGKARSIWWPCFVVAAGRGDCGPFKIERDIENVNLHRIPTVKMKQLIKARPLPTRTQNPKKKDFNDGMDSNFNLEPPANGGVVPDGYLIVEYFGSHEFGWIKSDTAVPMQFDLSKSIDGLIGISRFSLNWPAPPSKCCSNQEVLSEAMEAYCWLLSMQKYLGDSLYVSRMMKLPFVEVRAMLSSSNPMFPRPTNEREEAEEMEKRVFPSISELESRLQALHGMLEAKRAQENGSIGAPKAVSRHELIGIDPISYRLIESMDLLHLESFMTEQEVPDPVTIKPNRVVQLNSTDRELLDSKEAGMKRPLVVTASRGLTINEAKPSQSVDQPTDSLGPMRKRGKGYSSYDYNAPSHEPFSTEWVSSRLQQEWNAFVEDEADRAIWMLRYPKYVKAVEVKDEEPSNVATVGFCYGPCEFFNDPVNPLSDVIKSNNQVVVSKCPSIAEAPSSEKSIGSSTNALQRKAVYKANAVLRVSMICCWMEKVKPLHLQRYYVASSLTTDHVDSHHHANNPTMSGSSIGKLMPGTKSGVKRVESGLHVASSETNSDGNSAYWTSSNLPASTIHTTNTTSDNTLKRPERRKYTFRIRSPPYRPPGTIPPDRVIGTSNSNTSMHNESLNETADSSFNAGNSSSNIFILNAGCSKFVVGEGCVHSRLIHSEADILFMEHRKREVRKSILRKELDRIKREIQKLQIKALDRERHHQGGHLSSFQQQHPSSAMRAPSNTLNPPKILTPSNLLKPPSSSALTAPHLSMTSTSGPTKPNNLSSVLPVRPDNDVNRLVVAKNGVVNRPNNPHTNIATTINKYPVKSNVHPPPLSSNSLSSNLNRKVEPLHPSHTVGLSGVGSLSSGSGLKQTNKYTAPVKDVPSIATVPSTTIESTSSSIFDLLEAASKVEKESNAHNLTNHSKFPSQLSNNSMKVGGPPSTLMEVTPASQTMKDIRLHPHLVKSSIEKPLAVNQINKPYPKLPLQTHPKPVINLSKPEETSLSDRLIQPLPSTEGSDK